ncbi:MAG: ParA family protein [Chloroflexi bacterium]|nr:ParA family protein [Chloroflexota bacterium]
MGTTIALMNQKGGVGKTTMTIHLGVGLAAMGYQVAMVDMDPQGHIAMSFALVDDSGRPREGIFELLVNGEPLDSVLMMAPADEYESIQREPGGLLYILPGGQKTQLAAINIQLDGADFGAVERSLKPLQDRTDFVLIDTAPTASLFTPAILAAADFVLCPTEMSRLSLDGLEKITQMMANLAGLHNADILGIIPMMTRANTREHKDRLDELQELYPGKVWYKEEIALSTVWKEASDAARTVFTYAPRHSAVDTAWKLIDRFLKAVEGVPYGQV